MHVDQLPPAVEEDRRWGPQETLRDDRVESGVACWIARIADRMVGQEGLSVPAGVTDVGAQEGDLASVARRGVGEQPELGDTGGAPGAPGVDHDRIAAQGTDSCQERLL